MKNPQSFFENPFDDVKIRTIRLANFAQYSISSFKALSNSAAVGVQNGNYTEIINELTAALEGLRNELSKVDTTANKRKSRTLELNKFIEEFKQTMSEQEGFFAHLLGGRKSAAYRDFYPNGITEYTTALKKNLPTLLSRIKSAANDHSSMLGTSVAAMLTGFESRWQQLRDAQEQQKGKLSDSRDARTDARKALEVALFRAIYLVAIRFPFDAQACMRFFDFSLLEGVKHHQREEKVV